MQRFDTAGRWLEADYDVDGRVLTVVSTYVHSGDATGPRQREKYKFLNAMTKRLLQLTEHTDLARGRRRPQSSGIASWTSATGGATAPRPGSSRSERAYFDQVPGTERLRWVDVGRTWAGEVDGPYTWWANMGKAFDNDSGWRIDYHLASPALGELVRSYAVDRAPAWDQRWSDHAPVVVDYGL